MMWTGLNQRKFPRTVVACDVFVKGQGDGYAISTMTSNLSRGGICAMLGRALRKYDHVALKLLLEDGYDPPVECMGKIVWCIPAKLFRRKTTAFDTGIEFVNLSEDDAKRIDRFLAGQAKEREKNPLDPL